ncbi:MAG: response regulator transcription factor [Acidimicrobiales bacterium]|nr:response regulator transcription factor [Acidimicrobiales bacterium]
MDVVLVRWPAEKSRREQLAERGVPRLLVVEGGAPPPVVNDGLEDWIRVPAPATDLRARVEALVARSGTGGSDEVPHVDEHGVLRIGERWVSLPPIEANLARVLVARFGAVVGREELMSAGWPEGEPARNLLDVRMLRLRRRLLPLDLVIRTIRSRGYLLEHARV